MYQEELKKEQRILIQVRNTLGNIVKEVTPPAGNPNSLSNGTIEEIKYCFAVISGREKELADKLGIDQAKPHFADAAQPNASTNANASALSFVKLPKRASQSV
jgi:hypothetical protein